MVPAPDGNVGSLPSMTLSVRTPRKCVVCVTKTGNFFYFYVQSLNPHAFLKSLSSCIIFVSRMFPLRQKVMRPEACIGFPSVWGPWFLASGTSEPQAPLGLHQSPCLDFHIPEQSSQSGGLKSWEEKSLLGSSGSSSSEGREDGR